MSAHYPPRDGPPSPASLPRASSARRKPRGKSAVRGVIEEEPAAFLRALVALEPKQVDVKRAFDDLSHEELRNGIAALQSSALLKS